MRVHRDSFLPAECLGEHDIRRLVRHARKGEQSFERIGYLPAETLNEDLSHPAQIFRLITIESGRIDFLLQDALIGIRIITRRLVFLEQFLRDHVHALVGALCGKRRSHDQLKRVRPRDERPRHRIGFPKSP